MSESPNGERWGSAGPVWIAEQVLVYRLAIARSSLDDDVQEAVFAEVAESEDEVAALRRLLQRAVDLLITVGRYPESLRLAKDGSDAVDVLQRQLAQTVQMLDEVREEEEFFRRVDAGEIPPPDHGDMSDDADDCEERPGR